MSNGGNWPISLCASAGERTQPPFGPSVASNPCARIHSAETFPWAQSILMSSSLSSPAVHGRSRGSPHLLLIGTTTVGGGGRVLHASARTIQPPTNPRQPTNTAISKPLRDFRLPEDCSDIGLISGMSDDDSLSFAFIVKPRWNTHTSTQRPPLGRRDRMCLMEGDYSASAFHSRNLFSRNLFLISVDNRNIRSSNRDFSRRTLHKCNVI
jgi:hypothetical protein